MNVNIDKILASIPNATPEKRQQMRTNAQGWTANGTAGQRLAARQILDALDEQGAAENKASVAEVLGLNTTQRVVRAFKVKAMTDTEAKLIQALLDNPRSTSADLTKALGWKAQSWHLHFGMMCANRAADLWPAPVAEHRDNYFYCGILTDIENPGALFTMKPDVAAAFAELGLRPKRIA